MTFNISSYFDELRLSLEKLSLQSRVAFAIWCADALLRETRNYLEAKADVTQRLAMQEAIDYLWICASGQKSVKANASWLEQVCVAIEWGEESVAGNEELINGFAIEAIGALCCALEVSRTGSPRIAAMAAVNVLNKLDRQLSDELFVNSYSEAIWADSIWKDELERQRMMLVFLCGNPGLKHDQKLLFRE